MKVLVIGLGLIGGSICKALKKFTSHQVYVINRTEFKSNAAIADGAADGKGDLENDSYDVIWLCTYKEHIEKWVAEWLPKLKKGTILTDVCGLKGQMTEAMSEKCEKYGVHYIGTHPMAGKEVNGYFYSEADLFVGCNFILTPCKDTDRDAYNTIADMAKDMGASRIVECESYNHDKMIAYTSHMPHIVASSLIMNNLSSEAGAFAGGSFRDVTRVSTMEEKMWADLFLENKENLLEQLDIFIENIKKYRQLIADSDKKKLEAFIADGRRRKEESKAAIK